jgi:DNA-binding transcriptional MocR family regulator
MGAPSKNALALEANVSFGSPVNAGEHIENRGLAGAVGADETDDFSRIDLKAKLGQGHQAPKPYRNVIKFQVRHIAKPLIL